jgi:hypothetical protein
MRQVMPHRNNIDVHRTKCKGFFRGRLFEARESGPFGVYFACKNESDLNRIPV